MSGIQQMVFTNSRTLTSATDPYWSNVVFLLQSQNQADGSTTVSDLSQYSVPITNNSITWQDTQTKFGTTSLYFDGSTSWGNVNISNSTIKTAFDMTNTDWTWEFWAFPITSVTGYKQIVSFNGGGFATGGRFYAGLNNGYYAEGYTTTNTVLWQFYQTTGGWIGGTNPGWTIDTWQHFCCERYGANVSLYKDGTKVAYKNVGTTSSEGTHNFWSLGSDPGGTSKFSGYIDGLRFTKGVARYAANAASFSTPTTVLPTSQEQL